MPYIIWSCIGVFYNLHVGYFSIDTLGIRTVLNDILGGSGIISVYWFILDYVVRHFDVDTTSLLWRLGAPIPIGLVIVGITWIIRKIPILRQIVP